MQTKTWTKADASSIGGGSVNGRDALAMAAAAYSGPTPRRRPALIITFALEAEEPVIHFAAESASDERRLLAWLAGVPELVERVADAITEALEAER